MSFNNFKALIKVFKILYVFSPVSTFVNFVLMLLQGATAGIGILLLIPLLGMAGLSESLVSDSRLGELLEWGLSLISLPVNLASLLIIYVVILSLIAFIEYKLKERLSVTQQKMVSHYRSRLHEALISSRWSFILSHKMSDFYQALTEQIQSMGLALYLLLYLISQIVMVLVYLTMMIVLSWQTSLIVILIAFGLFLLTQPINNRVYKGSLLSVTQFKDIFKILGEHIGSIKMIKSFSAEEHFVQSLNDSNRVLENQVVKLSIAKAKSKMIYMVFATIFISFFVYIALKYLHIPFETLLVLLLVLSRILPNSLLVLTTYQQLLSEIPSVNDVQNSIEQCERNRDEGVYVPNNKTSKDIPVNESLQFKNVSYKYPNNSTEVIKNLTFKVKANQITALTGPSGIGKTTVVDLLTGLLIPTKGQIYIDDRELSNDILHQWRQSTAYVTQEVHLFHSSIRDNLNWVNKNITDEKIWQALEKASAKHFVERFENGLDTVIGDKGINISGGERQRLALARALLLKPKLLVLDEATSALDRDNERKIWKALNIIKEQITVIIIAHSEESIKGADSVIRLG